MSITGQAIKNENNNFDVFKYNKYMALYPFNDKESFSEWLLINHLTHDEFLTWFDKSYKTKIDQENCPWMDYLLNEYKPSEDIKTKYSNQFCVFIDFVIEKAVSDFTEKARNVPNTFLKEIDVSTFCKLLKTELSPILTHIVMQTLTLELNVERLSKNLLGDTSEERYNHYIDKLLDEHYKIKIFEEYPLLLKLLTSKTEQFITEYLEFYQRLVNDFPVLNLKFGSLGAFLDHTSEKGDSHNNGRQVRVCQFEKATIVYKPRNLIVDTLFQGLLKDLNKSANTNFKSYMSINKVDYGWCAFIGFLDCEDIEQTKIFYKTLGQYVALLYVLNSSDFHFENVIGSLEHPILIDLESIIHVDKNISSFDDVQTIHTVLKSFILPQRIYLHGQNSNIDFSVIGYDEGQISRGLLNNTDKVLRDDGRLEYADFEINTEKRTPNYQYFGINHKDAALLITDGFRELYTFFQKNKSWLIDNDNYLKLLNSTFRCLLKPTNVYGTIAQDLYHPDNLRNLHTRNLFMTNKLWSLDKPCQNEINYYEYISILNGDIPIFHFKPKSKHLTCGNFSQIKNYFNYSVAEKLDFIQSKLSTRDLKAQTWLIQASMATLNQESCIKEFKFNTSDKSDTSSLINQTAQELINTSLASTKGYKWLNWDLTNNKNIFISQSKVTDLFNGNLGSLLFLQYFGIISKDRKILNNVNFSVTSIIKLLEGFQLQNIGGFNGNGSYIYALSKFYLNSKNKHVLKLIERLNKNIMNVVHLDKTFDILSGSAGCILSLITAYKVFNNKAFITTAELCADHLINHFTQLEYGGGWRNPNSEGNELGGFSHGSTGIGYALATLSGLNGEMKYDKYITMAFDYEDSLYNPDTNNFADLRNQHNCDHIHSDYTGWCNGSLGIGIARLDMLKNKVSGNRTKQFKSEIPKFINKILETGFQNNDSLCHGNAGTLEYLFEVSELYPQHYSKKDFNNLLTKIEKDTLSKGIKNGTYFNMFDSGLMLGSIGLAYQLLRFKKPNIVGNILLLN